MRHYTLLVFLFLFAFGNAVAQSSDTYLLYFKDGGFLQCRQVDTLNGTISAVLISGTRLELSIVEVESVSRLRNERQLLPDGTSVLKRGFYTRFEMASMTARNANHFSAQSRRWGFGWYITRGFQFRPQWGVGLGIGYEMHDFNFIPIQAEMGGSFSEGFSDGASHKDFYLPFTWRLQIGYNLPAAKLTAGSDNAETLRGSWLLHPAVGILIPSRRGPLLQVDFGYRLQRYLRILNGTWSYTDRVLLKSFTFRLGIVFR